MGMTWDEKADAKLFVGVLKMVNTKLDYKALAEWMGPECTVPAVQHRIQRLKERVNSPVAADDDSAPATPEKRKRGPKKSSKKAVASNETEPNAKKQKKDEDDFDYE